MDKWKGIVGLLIGSFLGCGKSTTMTGAAANTSSPTLMETMICNIDLVQSVTPEALINYTMKAYSDGSYQITCAANQEGTEFYRYLSCPTTNPSIMTLEVFSDGLGWYSQTVELTSTYGGCTVIYN